MRNYSNERRKIYMKGIYHMTIGKMLTDMKRQKIARTILVPMCLIIALITCVFTIKPGLAEEATTGVDDPTTAVFNGEGDLISSYLDLNGIKLTLKTSSTSNPSYYEVSITLEDTTGLPRSITGSVNYAMNGAGWSNVTNGTNLTLPITTTMSVLVGHRHNYRYTTNLAPGSYFPAINDYNNRGYLSLIPGELSVLKGLPGNGITVTGPTTLTGLTISTPTVNPAVLDSFYYVKLEYVAPDGTWHTVPLTGPTYASLPDFVRVWTRTKDVPDIELTQSGTYTFYVWASASDSEANFSFYKPYMVETVDISGTKTWADSVAPTGTRPDSVTLTLQSRTGGDPWANVVDPPAPFWTDTDTDVWSYSYFGLPKYLADDVTEIDYRVVETPVPNYTTTYDPTHLNITNTYITVNVTGTKNWVGDSSAPAGTRPGSVTLTLQSRTGSNAWANVVNPPSPTWSNTGTNTWSYSYANLPKFLANGTTLIEYRVLETAVPNYDTTYDPSHLNVTNTYITTSIAGTKTWVGDAVAPSGTRPDSVTLVLQSRTGSNPWAAAVNPPAPTWTNTGTNVWSYSYTNLPKYLADGVTPIQYQVVEIPVPNYDTTYDASHLNITNTYKVTGVTGTKSWVGDASAPAGTRPTSITLTLQSRTGSNPWANTVNPPAPTWTNTDTDLWSYAYANLPQFLADGVTPIQYRVIETPVPNYDTTYDALQLNITNTYITTGISGTKRWVGDSIAPAGTRPDSVTLTLQSRTGSNPWADAANPPAPIWTNTSTDIWSYSYTGLPKYLADGTTVIQYRVVETPVPNYQTTYDPTHLYISNTYITVNVAGTKTWVGDSGAPVGTRPGSVTLTLQSRTGSNPWADAWYPLPPTWTNTGTDVWSYSFIGLPKYLADGTTLIEYRVVETAVPDYNTTYDPSHLNVTNTYNVTSVSGTKTWVGDAYAPAGTRPGSVTLTLQSRLGSGPWSDVLSPPAPTWTNTGTDVWSYSYTGLPKYAADGTTLIQYQVVETPVPNYTTSYDPSHLNVTNTYVTGPIFPETGGSGKTISLITGMLIILSVSMSFGGTLIYNRYRRRRCLNLRE